MDFIVVGAGISGASCARLLANKGYKVRVLEKNSYVGGTVYDYVEDGIMVQKHGPHIFRTNRKEVFDYLSNFTEWFKYEHRVLAYVGKKFIPVPFNLKGIDELFSEKDAKFIKETLTKEYSSNVKVPVLELKKHSNKIVRDFADFVLEKIFIYYSKKQWGLSIEELDPNVMARVPVYISYEDRYFTEDIQFQPKLGYTKVIENMLDHENIKVDLNIEAKEALCIKNNEIYFNNKKFEGKVIYSGAIDEFLDNKFGRLPYRSLSFKLEKHNVDSYQPGAVVNYTESEDFTRITEFKKFTQENDVPGKTIIIKEYSFPYVNDGKMVPYYPIKNSESERLFGLYTQEIEKIPNLYLVGRLGLYKYIDMETSVKMALDLCEQF